MTNRQWLATAKGRQIMASRPLGDRVAEHPTASRSAPMRKGAPSMMDTIQTCLEISLALSREGYDVSDKTFSMALIGAIGGRSQSERADALMALFAHLGIIKDGGS